jgi:hypothetical protein
MVIAGAKILTSDCVEAPAILIKSLTGFGKTEKEVSAFSGSLSTPGINAGPVDPRHAIPKLRFHH